MTRCPKAGKVTSRHGVLKQRETTSGHGVPKQRETTSGTVSQSKERQLRDTVSQSKKRQLLALIARNEKMSKKSNICGMKRAEKLICSFFIGGVKWRKMKSGFFIIHSFC